MGKYSPLRTKKKLNTVRANVFKDSYESVHEITMSPNKQKIVPQLTLNNTSPLRSTVSPKSLTQGYQTLQPKLER